MEFHPVPRFRAEQCGRSSGNQEEQHGNVWTRWPVISDPSFCSHIRSQHFDNDSGAMQNRILGAVQAERNSRRGRRHAAVVERRMADTFPWIDRETLDGLIARCEAVKSLADLPPVT